MGRDDLPFPPFKAPSLAPNFGDLRESTGKNLGPRGLKVEHF